MVDPKLQLTPFEALIDTSGNFLIETKEISYTYSLTVHSILQTRKYSAQKDNALVFANPKHNKPKQSSNLEGLLEDVLLNKGINKYNISDIHRGFGYGNWENLPAAEKEAININELIEADIFMNYLATEDKLIELNQAGKLKDYNIIHFATHALSIPELPDASAIILTNKISDGYLTPKEISKLELNADFVNLSACQTAIGKQYSSEGIIGFAQSFIQAGANGVITSLWNVSDESTAIFMTSFYSHYSKNKNVSKSLAITKREFINGNYGAEYKKPFYWAPYIYYGI